MSTYRTQRTDYRSEPGAPARLALALFFLALIGGLLVALTPSSPALRTAASEPSRSVVVLALSAADPKIFVSLKLAAAPAIEKTPIAEVQPSPSPEPIPPEPVAPDPIVESVPAAVAEVVAGPESVPEIVAVAEPIPEPVAPEPIVASVPAAVAEPEPVPEIVAVAEPIPEPVAPEPIVASVPAAVAEVVAEPEPVPEIIAVAEAAPEAVPEPAPEPLPEETPPVAAPETVAALEPAPKPAAEAVLRPTLVAAAPNSPDVVSPGAIPPDDDAPVPYAADALAADEAVAMPGDAPPPTVAEKTPPEETSPEETSQAAETAAATAAVADTPAAPPQPEILPETLAEMLAEPMLDLAKVPPDPVWLAYARPSDGSADRPRIAVVVAGLGLGRAAAMAAIKLPGAVSLAFVSHARDLQEWIDLARAAGHEVLLDIPMEPNNYPAVDPGPQALLTTLSEAENTERLNWHLDRASGYVGVTHSMGSRFTASADHMRPILSALKLRGLLFLDARTSADSVAASLATAIGLPRAINNRFLDTQASRPAIGRRLEEIERIAARVGFSVAVSHAYPVTIDRLERWIATLEAKKLALVPLSALVDKQEEE